MARNRSEIRKDLSKSHLHAIGLVAAEWSLLEFYILFILSKMTGMKLVTTVTLTAPSSIVSWLEALQKIAEREEAYKPGIPRLKKMCKTITMLLTERNGIVHACWLGAGAKNHLDKADGFGIPKRGKKIYVPVVKSAPDMRAIATQISEAQADLLAWWGQYTPRTAIPPSMLAQTLSALQSPQTNPTKLNTLLSPSPQSPKP